MRTVGIIPARYGSTRLPGKPLIELAGYPMVWWVYHRVASVETLNKVLIATDDKRIADICNKYNLPYIMTADTHQTAANRLQEVSETIIADFYIQLNGDEPLINVDAIKASIPNSIPQTIEFGTNIITEINEPSQVIDPANIKVVFDNDWNALYMSRAPIPYPYKALDFKFYKHVGIIGYNKMMLDFYKNSKPGKFELIEGIDTLRFLDYKKQLKLTLVPNCKSLSVDTYKDLELVRDVIGRRDNG
jgi:3-deoxy-manno-octulosonate cytidylyltransferase (CMP-KDO synthetase)